MKIDEAIKLLGDFKEGEYLCWALTFEDAVELGIEALKFVASWNKKQLPQHQIHLSGETE